MKCTAKQAEQVYPARIRWLYRGNVVEHPLLDRGEPAEIAELRRIMEEPEEMSCVEWVTT